MCIIMLLDDCNALWGVLALWLTAEIVSAARTQPTPQPHHIQHVTAQSVKSEDSASSLLAGYASSLCGYVPYLYSLVVWLHVFPNFPSYSLLSCAAIVCSHMYSHATNSYTHWIQSLKSEDSALDVFMCVGKYSSSAIEA